MTLLTGIPEIILNFSNLSLNLFKIISGQDLPPLPQSFFQGLQPGTVLQGKVLGVLPEGKALVDFEGQKVTVEFKTPFPLREGQNLTALVRQLNPVPVLKLLSVGPSGPGAKVADPIVSPTTQDADSGFSTRLTSSNKHSLQLLTRQDVRSLELSPLQEVEGKVSRVLDSRTALVRFGGRELPVNFSGQNQVKPGDRVSATVKIISGEAALVAREEGGPSGRVNIKMIKPYLPARQALDVMVTGLQKEVSSTFVLKTLKIDPELVGRMRRTLEVLAPIKDQTPSAARLKEQVELAGSRYEARIRSLVGESLSPEKKMAIARDLKGQLMEFSKQLHDLRGSNKIPPAFSKQVSELARTLTSAVDNIELKQLTHQLARQENVPLLLEIPNPFGADGKNVRLYLLHRTEEDGKRKRGQKGGFTLVFLLNLSALGDLRLDTQVSGQNVNLDIQVESKSVFEFIQTRVPEVQKGIEQLGFNAVVNCRQRDKVELNVESDLSRLMINESTRLVDIKT